MVQDQKIKLMKEQQITLDEKKKAYSCSDENRYRNKLEKLIGVKHLNGTALLSLL